MQYVKQIAFMNLITTCLKERWKLSPGLRFIALLLALTVTPEAIWANEIKVRFTASIDRIVGLEGVTLPAASNKVQGEIWFKQSNHLEPGFYDGHTWQNAVKRITFEAPINATFSGMGVSLYPDQKFISVFYDPDRCSDKGIMCSASGKSKFKMSDGTEIDLKALSYHLHQPDSENTPAQLAAVIERFIEHAGKGTTKALVRFQSKNSSEPVLTLLMTIDSVERSDAKQFVVVLAPEAGAIISNSQQQAATDDSNELYERTFEVSLLEEFRSDNQWFLQLNAPDRSQLDAYLVALGVKAMNIKESHFVNSPEFGGGPKAGAVRDGHTIYMVERDIPNIGLAPMEQLLKASKGSQGIIEQLGDNIEWDQSFLTDEGTFCVYRATDTNIIQEHASIAGINAKPTAVEHIVRNYSH